MGVRLSPIFNYFSMSDSDPQATFNHATKMLGGYGLAYVNVLELRAGAFDFSDLKRLFGGSYITNGGYDAQRPEKA